MGRKESVSDGFIPNFNMDLGFVLRLNELINNMTYARINKQGKLWADYILACYMEAYPDLSEEEIQKCEDLRKELLFQVVNLNNSKKDVSLSPQLHQVCWNFEVYVRELLMKHGLFNTKKQQYPEDKL